MSKLISTKPAKNYETVGEVDISSASEIKKGCAGQQSQSCMERISLREFTA